MTSLENCFNIKKMKLYFIKSFYGKIAAHTLSIIIQFDEFCFVLWYYLDCHSEILYPV